MRFVNAALRVLLWFVYALGAIVFGSVIALGVWLIWDIASQGGIYMVGSAAALAVFLCWLAIIGGGALLNYHRWGPSEL